MRENHNTQLGDSPQVTPETRPAEKMPRDASFWQLLQQQQRLFVSFLGDCISDVRISARRAWQSRLVSEWRSTLTAWRKKAYSGPLTLVAGTAVISGLALLSRQFFPVPNLGAIYIPLIALLAYYWSWPLGVIGCLVQLLCVYFLLLPPKIGFEPLTAGAEVELAMLAAISVYVLLLVQLARNRRDAAEREVGRFAAMNTVGAALTGELHEAQLLDLIARTACDLTGAEFAAFSLRPVDAMGRPLGPSEGSRFRLAAVVGTTPEQEEVFRRVPLGGEGLLAPIFRYGVTVRVDDALAQLPPDHHASPATNPSTAFTPTAPTQGDYLRHSDSSNGKARRESPRDVARKLAASYARGATSSRDLRAVGAPRGHPTVRSFLGAPLLDREGNVRGGLLLGHTEPDRFTKDDETLLKALAAQAAVSVENARLYHNAQSQAEELNAVFQSITDAVMVYDHKGNLIHENQAANTIRCLLDPHPDAPKVNPSITDVLSRLMPDIHNAESQHTQSTHAPFSLTDMRGEPREYVVSVSPLQQMPAGTEVADTTQASGDTTREVPGGTVVVWHEVTETRKLLAEQQAHAEAEARRTLLQKVIEEQPSGVYLVRGRDARLVLANNTAQEVWGAHWAEGQTMADFLASSGVQFLGSGGRPLGIDELGTVQTLRGNEAVSHLEEVVRRPDGTSLPVLLNAVALDPQMLEVVQISSTSDGTRSSQEPVALVVLQDVTAMKEAERLKDEFIAIAAHELKTPMAAVKGYADMLVRQVHHDKSPSLEPWQIEALETIDQATNRLVELTEDLLDVARLQAERIQLHIEPHDLIALARRVMKRFQMASDHHTLSLIAKEEFVVAALDVRRTEQILGNLLSNAIKYSPEGGPVTITIEPDEHAGVANLAVSDHGIGIPAHQQAILFNRFARADNARERGITGTGLGLYLCRELVELQGGQLWFASEEGNGSTFHMALPLAQDAGM